MAKSDEQVFLDTYDIHNFDVPLTTVDVVVFTVKNQELCVQLVYREQHPFRHNWALPGGFIDLDADDDLAATARRILLEKTGVKTPYVEQLGGFGNHHRDPRGWSTTFVYFALINIETLAAKDVQGRWEPIVGNTIATTLAFDHANLISAAVERLRSKVSYSSLPVHLLPERFTLKQCQSVFEIVLGHPLEKSAFRRRLHEADIVVQIPDAFERGSNRPAALYRLRQGKETIFFPGVLRSGAKRNN